MEPNNEPMMPPQAAPAQPAPEPINHITPEPPVTPPPAPAPEPMPQPDPVRPTPPPPPVTPIMPHPPVTPPPAAATPRAEHTGHTLLYSLAIIIAGGLIAGAVIWNSSRNPAPVPNLTGNQPPQPTVVDTSKLSTSTDPFIGATSSPVTMFYWYDYQCPFCKMNEEAAMPQIVQTYVNSGKLKVVFKDYAFLGPDSMTLGEYSRAVWEAAPDKFYAWHKAIFDAQGQENSGWATPAKITTITATVLGSDLANKVTALVSQKGGDYLKAMMADKAEGASIGVNSTPTAAIGNTLIQGAQPYAQFQSAIDDALQGK